MGWRQVKRDFFGESLLPDSAGYYLQQRQKFAPWLDSEDPRAVANCLRVLLHRTIVMI